MKEKRSFFGSLHRVLRGGSPEFVDPAPSDRLRLSGSSLRVPCSASSFLVEMGKQIVHICPDLPLDPDRRSAPYEYLIFDPALYHSGISHCLRLAPGASAAVDYREEHQKLIFGHSRDAFRRHLQIRHEGEFLVFRDPISELGTYLSVLADGPDSRRLEHAKARRAARITEIFGGPVRQLAPGRALELIREVNQSLNKDPYRQKDSLGNAGALVQLPGYLVPVLIGDLHGRVENLLKILCENSFLDSLDSGDAVLVFLGDAIHQEADGQLDEMDSSVLMTDLILKLKLAFPEQVFFVVGNHESFSPDVMKGGVPQSVLWEKRIRQLRGSEYLSELALFYRQSPLAVLSGDFVACHAGPPRGAVSREMLIEARQSPELVHELTWNRMKTKGWPVGYNKGDVKRFRKSLELEESLPFIVAHYPQSPEGTLWLNVGDIPNHHILYSARSDTVGVFTRVGGEMLPQVYPAESVLDYMNRKAGQAG